MKKIYLLLIGLLLVGGICGKARVTYALHSPQINQRGWAVWHRHDGNDREIFLYKGSGGPIQLTDNDYFDQNPMINKNGWVVWEGYDGNDSEIFLYKGNGAPIQLTDNDTDDESPRINKQGQVVWTGSDGNDREIFLYNGHGGPIQLTNNDADDYGPRINHQGQVVWTGHDGNDHEIFLYDSHYDSLLKKRGHARWTSHDGKAREIFLYKGRDKGRGGYIQLTDNEYDDYSPEINHKGWVVWYGHDGSDHEIFLYKGRGSPIQLTDNEFDDDYFPQINKRGQVVWQRHDGNDHEIFLYNGHGGPVQLTDNKHDDQAPFVSDGGWVVWNGYDGDDHELFRYKSHGYKGRGVLIPHTDNDVMDFEPRGNNRGQVVWSTTNGSTDEVKLSSPGPQGTQVQLLASYTTAELLPGPRHTVERVGNIFYDLTLPVDLAGGLLYLEAKGGDGGRRYYRENLLLINNHYADGGEGATLAAEFKIGDKPGQVPPGSRIRFILGEKGESDNSLGSAGAGGGGGTGILFLAPGAGNGEWQHLVVAGGGGGAYADCCKIAESGGGGEADLDCTDGHGGTWLGGGGWREDGLEEDSNAGWPNYDVNPAEPGPIGGKAPTMAPHLSDSSRGGWGYGGGGLTQGDLHPGGGGGGSCGGAGSAGFGYFDSGSGGKSWINQDFVSKEKLRQNGGTLRSPQDGYARYQVQESKLVFVTSTKHNGNLGGIAGGDAICNQLASAAGHAGTFKAWLGDSVTGPVDNFTLDQLATIFTLVNGEFVGKWSDLVGHELRNPISVTEQGDPVTDRVWTSVYAGETFTGNPEHYSCAKWTGRFPFNGVVGRSDSTDVNWTYDQLFLTRDCGDTYRLYCFEQ